MSQNEQKQLKDEFVTTMGEDNFDQGWQSLLSLDPAFFKASLSLASVPRRKSHLGPKEQALIGLAVDSAATHLYAPGIRTHIASAIKAGASIDEVLEVIELTSTLGIHACNIGVPLLVEVLREEGKYLDDITNPFDAKQQQLQQTFTERRGYWHTFWEDFLRLDPEFFEAYLELSGVPWIKDVPGASERGRGALTPKVCVTGSLRKRPDTTLANPHSDVELFFIDEGICLLCFRRCCDASLCARTKAPYEERAWVRGHSARDIGSIRDCVST
jgi:alkylhydroperoxidase/carboxymuconolactone decarboxylase family protein YurZ